MPNINISDARQRDAVVKAESTRNQNVVFYQDKNNLPAYTTKILKGAVNQDYGSLVEKFGDDEKLAEALVSGDPEINFEQDGMFLRDTARVFINPKEELVYRIRQEEVVYNPDGSVRETRQQRMLEANVDTDIPLTWSGKLIKKSDAIRKFVFTTKLQIVHINGLTYDFLYEMAKELDEAKSLMLLGAGPKGRQPLIFRSRSLPYRGFLEGRVQGDKYILLLHLSNLELKIPERDEEAEQEKARLAAEKAAKKKTTKKKTSTKKTTKKAATKKTKKKTAKKTTTKKTKKKTTKKKVTKKTSKVKKDA